MQGAKQYDKLKQDAGVIGCIVTAIPEVLFGLIEIVIDLIDNVWMRIFHIKIQSGGPTDENDITNFGNVIFE